MKLKSTLHIPVFLFLIAGLAVTPVDAQRLNARLAPVSPNWSIYLPVALSHHFEFRVLEDFESDRWMNWWSPDPQVFGYYETSERAHGGNRGFRITYQKSSAFQYLGADPLSPELADFRGAQTLEVWVYGQVTLLLKLEDRTFQQAEVGLLQAPDPQGWNRLQFQLTGVAGQIDLSRVKVLFFPAPGNANGSGTFYLDDIVLNGVP